MLYTISQASDMLGLPAVTIRAWEQRYGVVSPLRKQSGHRLFSQADLDDLRWLKEQTEHHGFSISQAAELLKEQKLEHKAKESARAQGDPHGDLRERLLDCLKNYRSEQARQLMDLGFSLFGYDAMIGGIVIPLMRQVGDEWTAGAITIAQEHFITQLIMQRCFSFAQVFPIDPGLPGVVALCPPGEHHHFGLMLFSLFLRQRGVDVLYLGPDTPGEGLDELIRMRDVAFVAVSLMDPERQPAALEMMDNLRASCRGLSFVLGGYGFRGVPEPYDACWLEHGSSDEWLEWFQQTMQTRRQFVGGNQQRQYMEQKREQR